MSNSRPSFARPLDKWSASCPVQVFAEHGHCVACGADFAKKSRFHHVAVSVIVTGEPWRCSGCGTPRGMFSRLASARVIAIDAKPAGPSTHEKAESGDCPSCGAAMMPGLELGEPVWNCGSCGAVWGR